MAVGGGIQGKGFAVSPPFLCDEMNLVCLFNDETLSAPPLRAQEVSVDWEGRGSRSVETLTGWPSTRNPQPEMSGTDGVNLAAMSASTLKISGTDLSSTEGDSLE